MSTSVSDKAMSEKAETPLAASSTEIRHPGRILLIILLVALGLRWWQFDFWKSPQQEEYGHFYAVAERQGLDPNKDIHVTPTTGNKLVAVPGWQEVRERSVLPYGIENPHPFYHYLLHKVMQVSLQWKPYDTEKGIDNDQIYWGVLFPLRLPSLIAGLGCVAGIYFLCRRLIGAGVALVAAAIVAVDPIQIGTSALAAPYAIANLACLGSFFFLLLVRQAPCLMSGAIAALAYGVCMALVGYLHPVLLFVVVGHLGLVVYWFLAEMGEVPTEEGDAVRTSQQTTMGKLAQSFRRNRPVVLPRTILWLAGLVVAVVLLVPQMKYIAATQSFVHTHRAWFPPLVQVFVWHNSTFIVALLVVLVASYVVRPEMEAPEGDAETKSSESITAAESGKVTEHANVASPSVETQKEPAVAQPPVPDNPDFLWLGRCWLFLPQALPFVLSFLLGQALFLSPFMTYTVLGGAILLAYLATRDPSREVRLGLSAAVVLVIFLCGFTGWPTGGTGLVSRAGYEFRPIGIPQNAPWQGLAAALDGVNEKGQPLWQAHDVILVRTGSREGDLLPYVQNRSRVEAVLLAPYTLLPSGAKPKPIVCLTYSNYRGGEVRTVDVRPGAPEQYYADFYSELVRRLQKNGYKRFLYKGLPDTRDEAKFLDCLLPRLADALGKDLVVARNRSEKTGERYFEVPGADPKGNKKGIASGEGLKDLKPADSSDQAAKEKEAKDFAVPIRIRTKDDPSAPKIGGKS